MVYYFIFINTVCLFYAPIVLLLLQYTSPLEDFSFRKVVGRNPISDICGVPLKRKQPTGMRYGVESQHRAAGLQCLPHTVSAWLHRFEEWQ